MQLRLNIGLNDEKFLNSLANNSYSSARESDLWQHEIGLSLCCGVETAFTDSGDEVAGSIDSTVKHPPKTFEGRT